MDPHRIAEARSLAYHAVVARRLQADPRLIERARVRVEQWIGEGRALSYAHAWRDLLARSIHEINAVLTGGDERAQALRHCSPFAGVLSPQERWALWREVRAQQERAR